MADSLLITGPPASGKSRAALNRFLYAPDALFIVPSSTMAEHVRHELARAGHLLRPNRVTTLARFLDDRALPAAPKALVGRLIEEALAHLHPVRFQGVAEYPGFRKALASLLDEVQPDAVGDDIRPVFEHVLRALAARGMALRRGQILACANDPGELPARVVLDGFFSLSPPELGLIASLAERTTVTVTLPDGAATAASRAHLLSLGFAEQKLDRVYRHPQSIAFTAPTFERETEEIARRILEEAARGRPFREMGIVLRVRETYAPALETTLARFGIPARFYFADALLEHPAIQYLSGVVRTMLEGWDHAALLALLRMPVSGVGATPPGDRFDFEFRKLLDGAGLPLAEIDDVPAVISAMSALESWRNDHTAASQWAARLKTLRALLPVPEITGGESRERLQSLRSTALALDGLDAALEEAVLILGEERTGLADFWRQTEASLAEPLRIPDRRRNVVHVMDVFEARQWELPVVFICGLVERMFPQYHGEDPLMNDVARRRAGLKTSADRQNEEGFLFELATTRATSQTILSYARFNEKGEHALPSQFLPDVPFEPCDGRIRPHPLQAAPAPSHASIQDAGLLAGLAKAHRKIATTSIERFLQCPFQFFAGKSLRLRPRPPAPRERLDLLLQGNILHRALADLVRMPLLGAAVLDDVFREECRRNRVPVTYRMEAVRLEMLRNFEGFLADRQIALGWPSRVEEPFELVLNPLLSVTGRIDRLDVGSGDRALVIDYKYSAGSKIRERIEENAAGNLVQGGLYLMAAQRCFGLKPIGMLYGGLRKAVVWDGWHLPVAGLEEIGESRATLNDFTDSAAAAAAQVFDSIISGRIAPEPADKTKCRWCDFKDICRVESAAHTRMAGAR